MPEITAHDAFASRHIGLDPTAIAHMLGVIGVASLDELAAKALPAEILDAVTDGVAPGLETLPTPASEHQTLAELRELADANTVAVSMIGQGYYDTLTPPVLLRTRALAPSTAPLNVIAPEPVLTVRPLASVEVPPTVTAPFAVVRCTKLIVPPPGIL